MRIGILLVCSLPLLASIESRIGDSSTVVVVAECSGFDIYGLDSLFSAEPLREAFDGYLLLDSAERGLISPSDPVQKYVRRKLQTDQKFTIKQLLSHTSGFVSKCDPLLFNPGEGRESSPAGIALLERILARVNGVSYEKLLTKTFVPLGMIRIHFRKGLIVSGEDLGCFLQASLLSRIGWEDEIGGRGALIMIDPDKLRGVAILSKTDRDLRSLGQQILEEWEEFNPNCSPYSEDCFSKL